MGSFKIEVTPGKMKLTLEGKFDQDYTAKFVQEFQGEVKKIQPSQCVLEIDASKFQVLPSEMHDTLKGCFELYRSMGFAKVLMHHENNVILTMQVKRIAKEAGLENFDIIA